LRQNGIDPSNLAGGITTWKLVQYQPPKPRPLSGAKARKETDVLNTNESAGVRGDAALQTQAASGSAAAMAGAADESPTEVTQTLDLRGLQCPGPLASLTQAAKQHAPGTTVRALASDIGFATDVDAWCRRGGHQLLHVERENGTIAADIKLAAQGTTKAATADNESADVASSKTMVVFSGDLDRVMGSFVIANAAADMGDKVTMFFTFWGLNALRKPEGAPVTKDFMSRMFGWMMPRGATKLKLSQMNMGGMGTAMMKGVMKRKNVDDLPTMIANAQRKGVRMVACSMSLDVMGLKPEELIDGVEIAGAAGYLAQASESRVNLFI
jgi:peroxiredoxin family protein/TusA-related sulfurtransferase